jgi:hypothetical protein
MQELTRDVCARVAMRWSLLFAALGVLAAFLLLVVLKIQALLTDIGPEFGSGIAVGLAMLCLSAALLGRLAGRVVYLTGNNILINLVLGVMLALGCVIVTAFAGSAVGVLMASSKEPSFVSSRALGDIIGLSLLILLWGSVPAALLGFLYGGLVKVTLDRKLKRTPGTSINQQTGDAL